METPNANQDRIERQSQIQNIRKYYPQWNGEVPRLENFQSGGLPADLDKDKNAQGVFGTKLFQSQASQQTMSEWAEPLHNFLKTTPSTRKILLGDDRASYGAEVAQQTNTQVESSRISMGIKAVQDHPDNSTASSTFLMKDTHIPPLPPDEPLSGYPALPSAPTESAFDQMLKQRKLENQFYTKKVNSTQVQQNRFALVQYRMHKRAFIPSEMLTAPLAEYRELFDNQTRSDEIALRSTLKSFTSSAGFVPSSKDIHILFPRDYS